MTSNSQPPPTSNGSMSSRRTSSPPQLAPPFLAGLGIKGFPDMNNRAEETSQNQVQEVELPRRPSVQVEGSPYLPMFDPESTISSPRLANTTMFARRESGKYPFSQTQLQAPSSPGMLYPFAQHGSSLSQFKAQSQVPASPRLDFDYMIPSTPTPGRTLRSSSDMSSTPGGTYASGGTSSPTNGMGAMVRPMLLRTPPTDHPTGMVKQLTGDEDEEEQDEEDEEGKSILPDLPMSPARFAFTSQFPTSSHALPSQSGAKADSPVSPHTATQEKFPTNPFTSDPLQTPTSQRHARKYSIPDSRIHARNLSLFFPHPSSSGPVIQPPSSPRLNAPVTDMKSTLKKAPGRPGLGAAGGFSFGASSGALKVGDGALGEDAGTHTVVGRRGHHHKHSLSHNFFSFLDPTVTNPNLPNSAETTLSTQANATPRPMATTFINGTQSGQLRSASVTSPLLPSPIVNPKPSKSIVSQTLSLSRSAKLTLAFGIMQFLIGSAVWVSGQAGGGVGLTGLGYLIVFEAIGVWVKLWGQVLRLGDGAVSSSRRPFGSHRKESLLYFVQCIFLLFSAVYISKEALERVLMSSAGSEGGHSHGHSHGGDHSEGFPLILLVLAFAASLTAGLVLDNHSKLVEAVGPSIMPSTRHRSARKAARNQWLAKYFESLDIFLSNPFSLAISACIAVFLVGNLALSPQQLPKLDRVMAFVEALLAFWLSYPSSIVFGQVLLQTAPPEQSIQMLAFKQVIRDIKNNPSVIRVAPPHIWQLTPHDPRSLATSQTPRATPASSRRPSIDRSMSTISPRGLTRAMTGLPTMASSAHASCVLVTNLTIYVRDDLDDKEILDLTRYGYERCVDAVGATQGRKSSFGGSGDAGGEVTITVKRDSEREEEDRMLLDEKKHNHDHDHDHHHHDHSHHNHNHTHENGHHSDQHDHDHKHTHNEHHHHSHPKEVMKHEHNHEQHHVHEHHGCSHRH